MTFDAILNANATVALPANRPARVTMLAYSGGPMRPHVRPPLKYPVVVDLATLQLPQQAKFLADHESTLSGVVGHGAVAVRDGRLYAEGIVSRSSPAGLQIIALAGEGFPFEASIGIAFDGLRLLAAGDRERVNGQPVAGPAYVTTGGRLREISILPTGADSSTSISLAARRASHPNRKKATMNLNPFSRGQQATTTDTDELDDAPTRNTPQRGALLGVRNGNLVFADIDPEDIERDSPMEAASMEARRIAKIQSLTGGNPELEAKAVDNDWTIAKLRTRIELENLKAMRHRAPSSRSGNETSYQQVMEASLLRRFGLEGVAEKAVGSAALQAARGVETMSDLVRMAMLAEGKRPEGLDRGELAAAAFSTVSLPQALGNTVNRMLQSAYEESPATWEDFSAVRTAKDFRQHTDIRPSTLGGLEELPHGGEVRHATLDETGYTYQISTYAKMLRIDRRDVINDDLGYFQQIAESFGRNARRKLNDVVYSVLLAPPAGHFDAANANLLDSSNANGSLLSAATLEDAITLMLRQVDDESNNLDLTPTVLLVPPELRETAKALLESEFLQRIADTDRLPTGNPQRSALKLVVEPRLSNLTKFTGASATAWYLLGSPRTVPMSVAFLGGNRNPTVSSWGVESEAETLGMTWRVHHDFGAALADERAAVKASGQAPV